jgi:MFS family permease
LNVPISQLQLPLGAMLIMCALISPIVGSLADKYPTRTLFGCGLAGMSVFYLLMSFASAVWQMVVLYGVVASVSLTLATGIPANALISRWFVRHLGVALGLSSFGAILGGVLMPPVIAMLLPEFGWRVIWRGVGLMVGLVVLPVMLFTIRNRPTGREGLHYVNGGAARTLHGGASGRLTMRDILVRPKFWLFLAIYLPMLGFHMGCAQNLAPYAANHGLSPKAASLLVSILSISQIVATLALGMLSDRFGNRLPFAGLGMTLAVGALIFAFGTGMPAAVAGAMIAGCGGGVLVLLSAAIVAEFGAEGVGRGFGLCMFFLPLAAMSPFVIARTHEATGSYAPAFLAMAALVTISAGLSLFLKERPVVQKANASADEALA